MAQSIIRDVISDINHMALHSVVRDERLSTSQSMAKTQEHLCGFHDLRDFHVPGYDELHIAGTKYHLSPALWISLCQVSCPSEGVMSIRKHSILAGLP